MAASHYLSALLAPIEGWTSYPLSYLIVAVLADDGTVRILRLLYAHLDVSARASVRLCQEPFEMGAPFSEPGQ